MECIEKGCGYSERMGDVRFSIEAIFLSDMKTNHQFEGADYPSARGAGEFVQKVQELVQSDFSA